MLRVALIFGLFAALFASGTGRAIAQTQESPPDSASTGTTRTIDGIAARIEDDIITESEVRELAAFQELVDGRSKSREEIIRELADQWIVRQEATAASFGQPSQEDVDRAYEQLVKQFPPPEEFKRRCGALGLSEAAIRRLLQQQLYLSRFLDRRFRPAAQVDHDQIEAYYENEFAPQLKARSEAVPALDDVEDTIREVLIQRAITERSKKWLDDTRDRLRIEILPEGAAS
jgi:hypothetical protein